MKEIFSKDVLKGKVSVMTGGGRGLGEVMALAPARAGSDIVLAARSSDQIEGVAREISAIGRRPLPVKMDVTKSEDITRMVEKALSEFGKIDILVNNAGQKASY
ncbi:MAG: SDR family NAD(P)-dependent oxidoreductase, partial [Deltaproteobacteria bacterium]|nr:SDR family NAD(P)-dependent oxidoreductase [Deltaproteobacteria bacterium]